MSQQRLKNKRNYLFKVIKFSFHRSSTQPNEITKHHKKTVEKNLNVIKLYQKKKIFLTFIINFCFFKVKITSKQKTYFRSSN